MTELDPAQRLVLELDPHRHASVLGAPGSGKTRVLVESFARVTGELGWSDEEVLVLASSRLSSAALRTAIERRVQRAIAGTPVRTPVSLAFALLTREAAALGDEGPRLLTGPAHDEVTAEVISDLLASNPETRHMQFPADLMTSEAFRAELRELSRVLDDAALTPAAFDALLDRAMNGAVDSSSVPRPAEQLVSQWRAALTVLSEVETRLLERRPGELSSSRLLREAARVLTSGSAHAAGRTAPRLILIDDAQELTEGDLALLAASASSGSTIWAFGDPDIATSAFRGERVDLLTRLDAELSRRGAASVSAGSPPQRVILDRVHRQTPELRALVRRLTERIGAAAAGGQRTADSARDDIEGSGVQFASVSSRSEQLGVIAHRLRRRRLGLDGHDPLAWTDMAVVCRTRAEADATARALAGLGAPASVAAGGIVLREQRIVRELVRLLRHTLGLAPLGTEEVLEILGGEIGGLDPIAVRRLRAALRLQERRAARDEGREPRDLDEIVMHAVLAAADAPVIDSAAGRALRRIATALARAARAAEANATPREMLWELWDATGLARVMQEEALSGRGASADSADRALDGVLGLFFVLQRHEEQDSGIPIAEVLEEVLTGSVPEDSLAARSRRDVVTVTTPQGLVGAEFSLVAVLGPQDGVWPNLRARGSLIGVTALERWLRGDPAEPPARRDTLHDELRLFAHTCARARDELIAVAISDEDHHPSTFFSLAHRALDTELPSARLTLRGAVAEMRRRLVRDPDDAEALASLTALARAEVPGAHPDEWYGAKRPTTDAPLVDLAADPEQRVPVSPSQLERAEQCPLDWAIDRLSGGVAGTSSQLGTLIHRAFEQVDEPDTEQIMAVVESGWDALEFDAHWESERALRLARTMAEGIAAYLADFDASSRSLVAHEAVFTTQIGRAELRGTADRLELIHGSDGREALLVIDLKTGRTAPGGAALEGHAQLQAYQLGAISGAFGTEHESAGAALVYVHPDALRASDHAFSLRTQQPLDEEGVTTISERIARAAEVMAGARFTARVEHHCSDRFSLGGACRLHIIPAVSQA